ncbi:hypothetical protein F4561_001162 [Lipingzhangella halophila]|uniref:Uncharacterized protein n=1 Tax=Lipingzhangella halophila TaxID=1783352 RepID=A0A7W7W0W5_9ACTN|nr:DUF6703 family protein [Lipingzhangella halophila]MBB4930342.1 hypothetical protein [Lipingzhangella halophila]
MSSERDESEQNRSAPRSGGDPPHSRRLPNGDTFYTPDANQLRREIERRSAVPLVWLHNAPRWLLPATMAAVFVGGLLLSGVAGAVLLAVLAAFFGWLAYLAWPNLRRGERTMRVIVVATLFGLGLLQSGVF